MKERKGLSGEVQKKEKKYEKGGSTARNGLAGRFRDDYPASPRNLLRTSFDWKIWHPSEKKGGGL